MKERILTCIICPRGCELHVRLDENGAPVSVAGNACPRGESYAVTECTAPMRTVTTTVRCESGAVVPVKTDKAVPKALVFEVMRVINSTVASDSLSVGDVVITAVAGTEANVVVTGKRA